MIRLRRQRTVRVALIAALALLIAQIGAVRHVYAHVAEGAAVPTLKQQQPGALHDFCGDCLNYAPLLAAAAAGGAVSFDAPPTRPDEAPVRAAHPPRAGPFPAFRSRAPPATT